MPIYMNVPYAPGSVTRGDKFDQWIELSGFQLGVDRGLAMEMGSGQTLVQGPPKFSTFMITKSLEDSSMPLMQAAMGVLESYPTVKIAMTSEKKSKEYLLYELFGAAISSYEVSSSGDIPLEMVAFCFSEIKATFSPYDKTHAGDSKLEASYDLKIAGA